MKHIIIWISALTIAGCNHAPQFRVVERCIIDLELFSCLCHPVEVTRNHIGQVPGSETIIHDIDYCQKVIGYRSVKLEGETSSPFQKRAEDGERFRLWLNDQKKLKRRLK